MRGLAGKVILVTGSSTGIGYAMAERLIADAVAESSAQFRTADADERVTAFADRRPLR